MQIAQSWARRMFFFVKSPLQLFGYLKGKQVLKSVTPSQLIDAPRYSVEFG
jgi:hypothetical protein